MKTNLQAQDLVVFRTPLLPFATLTDLSAKKLKALFQQPILQEALFLASPDLYESLQTWLQGELKAGKDQEKLEVTLTKYLLRMSYRCTPFGLFAGISTATFGQVTAVELAGRDAYQRHSRLDMDYLCALAGKVSQQIELRNTFTYFPSNTLYLVGEQLRYVEYRVQQKLRTHHLVNIDCSEYIHRVLRQASQGASIRELAGSLVDEDISLDEATVFIHQLINNQVLVSPLEPCITGESYINRLITILQQSDSGILTAGVLKEVEAHLRLADQDMSGRGVNCYQHIIRQLPQLEVPFEKGQLFQTDLWKPARQGTLHSQVATELHEAIEVLAKLQNPKETEPANLRRFQEDFYLRYEEQEVPLLEVMDAEMGLGYPVRAHIAEDSPLLDDIVIPAPESGSESYAWSDWQQFLLEKYLDGLGKQTYVWQLDAKELRSFLKNTSPRLAASLYSKGTLIASSAAAIDQGDFAIYHHLTAGPSAASLLGRFCHLDEKLTEQVKKLLQAEEQTCPEAVFAEIVHINQARIGNISMRPVLREYEIPIIVQASVDEAHTIRLEDLLVSVRNNRIVLWSKRLNKEIIPRLSTAHNYSLQALPVYQFLCDLQYQQVQSSLYWTWGALSKAPFLPQVRYGKVIVAKARWVLTKEELAILTQTKEGDWLEQWRLLRKRRNLPKWVTVGEGDTVLPLDLENKLCLKVLQGLLKNKSSLILEECLVQEDKLWVTGPEGCFTHEFILPLQYSSVQPIASASLPAHNRVFTVPRQFCPGSAWLFAKIFCGVRTADTILTDVIKPLTESLLAAGLIDKWFFIRYNDPEPHLRVRFHGQGSFYGTVLGQLQKALQPYLEAKLVTNLQTDTYQRELERYGAENIEDSEAVFFHDSKAVIDLLDLLAGDEGDTIRWQLAIRGVDHLLADFRFDLQAKRQLIDGLQANFKQEFGMDNPESRKSLAAKFRQERKQMEQLLSPFDDKNHKLAPAFQILEQRSEQWHELLQSIRDKTWSVPIDQVVRSYIHMFLNRIFHSSHRMQEMVVYHLLFQHYTSAVARESKEISLCQ
jgi:thiopeptide-type bacteriocin biosynthesis protein